MGPPSVTGTLRNPVVNLFVRCDSWDILPWEALAGFLQASGV